MAVCQYLAYSPPPQPGKSALDQLFDKPRRRKRCIALKIYNRIKFGVFLGDLGTAFGEFTRHWPPSPFAYLHILAVDPAHQGRGLGRRVIAPGIAAAREQGLSIGLETTNPRNHSFYRSVGFTDVETFEVADGAPPATAMRLD